jgi:hypothetical protein
LSNDRRHSSNLAEGLWLTAVAGRNLSVVTQAIFGLLGVLVGGLVTFGVEMVLQQHRENELVRQAARLVGFDLQVSSRVTRLALKQDELWLEQDRPAVPSWPEARTALAGALDANGWKLVTTAVLLVGLAATDYERVSPLSQADRRLLAKTAEAADKANSHLRGLTGDDRASESAAPDRR